MRRNEGKDTHLIGHLKLSSNLTNDPFLKLFYVIKTLYLIKRRNGGSPFLTRWSEWCIQVSAVSWFSQQIMYNSSIEWLKENKNNYINQRFRILCVSERIGCRINSMTFLSRSIQSDLDLHCSSISNRGLSIQKSFCSK